MLSVFISTSKVQQNHALKSFIANYVAIEKLDMTIEQTTTNPDEILNFIDPPSRLTGLYFVEVPTNLLEPTLRLILKIREADPLGKVVLLSSSSHLLLPLVLPYHIEPLDLIDLDNLADITNQVTACLKTAQNRHTSPLLTGRDFYLVKSQGTIRSIPYEEIILAETSTRPHQITLHLKEEAIPHYANLRTIQDLSTTFIRPHHSYVINMSHFLQVDYKAKMIYLTGDQTSPLSRSGAVRIKNYLTEKPKNLRNKVRDL